MDNKRSSIYPGPWSKTKVAISICFHDIAMIPNVRWPAQEGRDIIYIEKSPVPL
ncbi:MAG: hypothetical protein JW732_09215 [Dehalococcoidia bacterium]|nr:hypothetical protein [Dehalococcoidia bacterium]